MLHSLDLDRGDGCARDPREQCAAKRVTERVPETWFERFDNDPRADIGNRFFFYLGTLND
jgi:hypothetical protein